MILRKPDYYNQFHCIASECKHTCCASWEIDVDDKTYDYYSKVEGEIGEQLHKWVKKEDRKYFKMRHGYCPFLTKEHLCGLYIQLGDQALCDICRNYPRSSETYGEIKEMCLGLSCEEVGRILFSKKDIIQFEDTVVENTTFVEQCANSPLVESNDSNTPITEDTKLTSSRIGWLEAARKECIDILQNRSIQFHKRIKQYITFSSLIQNCLNQKEYSDINTMEEQLSLMSSMEEPCTIKKQVQENLQNTTDIPDHILLHKLFRQRADVIMNMEVMEEEWEQLTNNVMRAFHADGHEAVYQEVSDHFEAYYKEREYEFEHLLVYFSYRYLLKSEKDSKFLDRAKFAVICYLIVRDIDRMKYLLNGETFTMEDQIDTLRIFSKQIEHSQKSLEYLEKIIASEDIFSTKNLLSQI